MPLYCFTNDDGETITRTFRMNAIPKVVREDGVIYRRDLLAEHGGTVHKPGNWPLESEALAVHPDEVVEAAADASKRGVPTDFNRATGAPVFTSASHRRAYCRAYGFFDKNAGFSDPTPGGRR